MVKNLVALALALVACSMGMKLGARLVAPKTT